MRYCGQSCIRFDVPSAPQPLNFTSSTCSLRASCCPSSLLPSMPKTVSFHSLLITEVRYTVTLHSVEDFIGFQILYIKSSSTGKINIHKKDHREKINLTDSHPVPHVYNWSSGMCCHGNERRWRVCKAVLTVAIDGFGCTEESCRLLVTGQLCDFGFYTETLDVIRMVSVYHRGLRSSLARTHARTHGWVRKEEMEKFEM